MTLFQLVPWLAMAVSLATIVMIPLLGDRPPRSLPRGEAGDRAAFLPRRRT